MKMVNLYKVKLNKITITLKNEGIVINPNDA